MRVSELSCWIGVVACAAALVAIPVGTTWIAAEGPRWLRDGQDMSFGLFASAFVAFFLVASAGGGLLAMAMSKREAAR